MFANLIILGAGILGIVYAVYQRMLIAREKYGPCQTPLRVCMHREVERNIHTHIDCRLRTDCQTLQTLSRLAREPRRAALGLQWTRLMLRLLVLEGQMTTMAWWPPLMSSHARWLCSSTYVNCEL